MKRISVLVNLLFATVLLSVAANAEQISGTTSRVMATLIGEVSVSELAVSETNQLALEAQQSAPASEQPTHRLPDGGLTSEPGKATLDALPWTIEPNAATSRATAIAPSFSSIKGFVGIHESDNVSVNHEELEPPDQGLAVNANVAADQQQRGPLL